jgi:hypothetical protein
VGAQQRFLRDRMEWLAAYVNRDERTVRRRVDEAVALLAERIGDAGWQSRRAAETPSGGWHLESVRTLVRVDGSGYEVLEDRRIMATGPPLDTLALAVSLPRFGETPARERDLLADVMYGGLLIRRERPSESLFRFIVELPHVLRPGDTHEFGVRFAAPPGQEMAPHYAFTPLTRCDACHIRVRFGHRRPERLWLLNGLPPRTIDDDPEGLPPAEVDRVGEAETSFANLGLGLGYGFRWQV